jgi:mycofactocin precursor peptide peptidase
MLISTITWGDVHSGPPRTLVVPVGSVEQHGPHLPLDTDVRVAVSVAAALEAADPSLVLAPAVAFGAAGEHEGFPGTVSIGHEGLTLLLVELGRSACRWAARVVFVNGHGGNVATLVEACALLRYEGRDVAWIPCAAQGDAHAGRTETSLMLALDPSVVGAEREPGATAPLRELLPRMREEGVRGVSENGILGDPRGASAEEGRALLDAMVSEASAAISRWAVDNSTARLR